MCKVQYSWKIWWGIKFGGLVILFQTAIFNFAKMFAIHRRLWNVVDKLPNLNFTNVTIIWHLGGQTAKFLTANISSYI